MGPPLQKRLMKIFLEDMTVIAEDHLRQSRLDSEALENAPTEYTACTIFFLSKEHFILPTYTVIVVGGVHANKQRRRYFDVPGLLHCCTNEEEGRATSDFYKLHLSGT